MTLRAVELAASVAAIVFAVLSAYVSVRLCRHARHELRTAQWLREQAVETLEAARALTES